MSKSGDRLKARTRILVLHKSGAAEINCQHCGHALTIGKLDTPLQLEKTIQSPRLVIKNRQK